jgi:NitT/TauT family transport system ATP-binding protein
MTTESSGPAYISLDGIRQVFKLRTDKAAEGQPRANTELVALDGINLEIPDGQFVALVGASGCGKTTLLNMIAGLVEPSEGEIVVGGKQPTVPNMDVGYMFARDALMPWRTAQRNVELPLETRGRPRKERQARAREMLDMVGLKGRERQYRLQLSQGMRQRVALARTLAPNPSLLLMDEPFAALDARTKLTMQAEFLRIWEEHHGSDGKKTVVFVTHDLQEAVLLADRVIVMLPHPGRIAEDRIIDLPRPRANQLGEMLFTDEFKRIAHELFECLEGAIVRPTPGSGPQESRR